MIRAAIYARFSSDLQRDASIEDQIRDCTAYAESRGMNVVDNYADRGISGASTLTRPEFQRMMRDAKAGRFQVIIIEALDRFSRNLADTARLFDELKFQNVEIQTLSGGTVNTMQIGFMGTMNQMFLEELAKKTRRGQRGRVAAGRIPGGLSFGYDMVPGDERGRRVINPDQAKIVRRIFRDYAKGISPRKIAKQLNSEGIASPRGREWQASTINGNVKRGNGILPNRLYIGEIVYNRQTFTKDPRTGKRRGRMNPESEWIIEPVPELRIIDQKLWDKVAARKAKNTSYPTYQRRAKYLLTGILSCHKCGGPYIRSGPKYMRCSHNRERGTCTNDQSIRTDIAENRILGALRKNLMHPKFIQVFIDEYRAEWDRISANQSTDHDTVKRAVVKKQKAVDAITDIIETGVISEALIEKLSARERELKALKFKLSQTPARPNLPKPQNIAAIWRQTLSNIYDLVKSGQIEVAAETLAKVLERVIVIPKPENSFELQIHGYLNSKDGCGGLHPPILFRIAA